MAAPSTSEYQQTPFSILTTAIGRLNDPSLTELDLSSKALNGTGAKTGPGSNPLPLGIKILAEALKHNSTLTFLDLSGNSISAEDTGVLADGLKTNSSLTKLDFSQNNASDTGVARFAEALKANTALIELALNQNGITEEGAARLADALTINSSLTTLYLFHNLVKDAGATFFAQALKTNRTLTKLYLARNGVKAKGAGCLAESLITNSTITSLDLNYNSVKDDGAAHFAKALKCNFTLTSLLLGNNGLTTKGGNLLANALDTNATLTKLEFQNTLGTTDKALLKRIQDKLDQNKLQVFEDASANSSSTPAASSSDGPVASKPATSSTINLTPPAPTLGSPVLSRKAQLQAERESAQAAELEAASCKAAELQTKTAEADRAALLESQLKIEQKTRMQEAERLQTEQLAANNKALQVARAEVALYKQSPAVRRDPRLLALLCEKKIPQEIQDKLFDHEGLDFETFKYFEVELLQRVGLPQARAKLLFEAFQQLVISPSSPFPSLSSSSSSPQSFSSPARPSTPISIGSSAPFPPFISTASPHLLIGRDLPHLTDEETQPLTRGAQGMIYLAKYAGAPCVVKRFIREIHRPEFDREVQAWEKFRHPNIVQLLAFLGPPDAMIVMERMTCSLYELLKDKSKQLSFLRRVEMGGQIAAGIGYLHAEGFVHRDIKSLNVLVKDNDLKLADFGETHSTKGLLSGMNLKGTTRWIAPELYLGARSTQTSDVFAMGMTLWELLCRKIPFEELGNDGEAIMRTISHGGRPQFHVHLDAGDDIDQVFIGRFREIIDCCWAQMPQDRPRAADVIRVLIEIPRARSPAAFAVSVAASASAARPECAFFFFRAAPLRSSTLSSRSQWFYHGDASQID